MSSATASQKDQRRGERGIESTPETANRQILYKKENFPTSPYRHGTPELLYLLDAAGAQIVQDFEEKNGDLRSMPRQFCASTRGRSFYATPLELNSLRC